ncbi:MAG: hypothetical protein LBV40_01515 [Methanomicrobiales archaeon]|jgi:hypothetical protein|nr:hypothetical protein [Methanomicrobiales archaeon]
MNDRSKVIAYLKQIGIKVDPNEFNNRLLIQKIVYLLKLKGFDIKYYYGTPYFEKRGVYSIELANDYCSYKNEFYELKTSYKLNKDEYEVLAEFKSLFGFSTPLLEAGTTYAYFAYEKGIEASNAYNKVKELKSKYCSPYEIAIGVSKVKEFLFEPIEEDKMLLERETAPWRTVGIHV